MAHMKNRRVGRVEQVWKKRRDDKIGYMSANKKKSQDGKKYQNKPKRLFSDEYEEFLDQFVDCLCSENDDEEEE